MKCLKQPPIYVPNFILLFFLLLINNIVLALTLTKKELITIIEKELVRKYSNAYLKSISFYGDSLNLPNRPLQFTIKQQGGFRLEILDLITGKLVKVIPINVKFKVKVAITKRDINPGSIIKKSDFIQREILIPAEFISYYITNPTGYIAKIFIPKDKIILKKYLEVQKNILPNYKNRNRSVKVLFIKKNLIIESSGFILSRTSHGKVKVKIGKKIFEGSLENEEKVIINLP